MMSRFFTKLDENGLVKMEDVRDAIIKVTSCALCCSDMHILDGVFQHAAWRRRRPRDLGQAVEVGSG